MIHTFEVFVDIKEFFDTTNVFHNGTARYEITAESIREADYMARSQALHDYPKGAEYDIRVTKVLK
ncbi:MAG: hypothetical protein NW224_02625 [Leptolyngbyaceae cyanobacterium bins.302]|nr:hypothetical protein [Leptolyngbyaceae cyanobacterium bins.302]